MKWDENRRRRQQQRDWPEAVCYVLLLIAFVTGAVALGVCDASAGNIRRLGLR